VADREKEEALVFKGEDQHYAQVTKTLGGGRFDLDCDDTVQRIGKLRGNMRRSQWVAVGCIVLISLREFDTASAKADILLKYSDSAIKYLRKYGELEWLAKKTQCEEEDDIVFEDDDDIDVDLV
jgi:translation initiation factor 1A